jgi:hypothetical protein
MHLTSSTALQLVIIALLMVLVAFWRELGPRLVDLVSTL